MVKNGEAKEHLRYSIDSLYNYTLSVGDLHTRLDVGHGVKVLFLPCFFFFWGGGVHSLFSFENFFSLVSMQVV